ASRSRRSRPGCRPTSASSIPTRHGSCAPRPCEARARTRRSSDSRRSGACASRLPAEASFTKKAERRARLPRRSGWLATSQPAVGRPTPPTSCRTRSSPNRHPSPCKGSRWTTAATRECSRAKAPRGTATARPAGRRIRRIAALVLKVREAVVGLQRFDEPLLRDELLGKLLSRDERVVDVAERVLDRLAIVRKHRALRRFRLRDLCADKSRREDRAGQLARVAPYARRALEEARQLAARGAEGAGQRYRRKVQRLRGADLRVGRDELLLGLHEIGTALEQRRRHAGRHRRQHELVDAPPARDRTRMATEQQRKRVLGLRDLRFD